MTSRLHDLGYGPVETRPRPAGVFVFDDEASPARALMQRRALAAPVDGEVQALLAARVLRLNPTRRVATVALKPVGRGRSYAGAYAGGVEQLAPVTAGGLRPGRRLGRVVKVNPTAAGAELDLIIGDKGAWESLAAGTASVDVLVAFERSSISGDPVGGRPVRVEIG